MKKRIILFFLLLCMLSACAHVSDEDLKQANYHYQIGISYFHDNNIQPAYVELQKAMELNPYDKQIHNALGIIYLSKLEDYPKAVEHFKKALKIDENYSEAMTNIGNAYAKMGEYNNAIDSYRTAISKPFYRNPALALYNLCMVYYRLAKCEADLHDPAQASSLASCRRLTRPRRQSLPESCPRRNRITFDSGLCRYGMQRGEMSCRSP